jgi:hypothetical protein
MKDKWYNMADYWQPSYKMSDIDDVIQQKVECTAHQDLVKWVKQIGRK